ncbi:hypothetical protein Agabi119p4_10665 [Agaricus bisporus var. burnettii]|uniref:Uncharacterized protein n=1 Tax=Agaricus bisporus var. burnettii TaxID=192524 RepID=A0A8H7C3E7_AGABI|nr:hypothetical protein Agabi119p4_10665 [Agaricus bisporus var. burnettii]
MMDTTILSDDDIIHMLSNDQHDQLTLTAAQESALMVQLAAELSKTNYDDTPPPIEIITPSETGQGTHKRWVYPPTWDDIMGGIIANSVICDSHCQETKFDSQASDDDISFDLLLPPHSYFDMSPLPDINPQLPDIFDDPSLPLPLFSNPFQFSDSDLERLMVTPTPSIASVPSAPKRPYRTSQALTKGENGGMEEDGLDMGIDSDDDECLNTPPRLLWERSGSKDSARVAGDDQDDDPFL